MRGVAMNILGMAGEQTGTFPLGIYLRAELLGSES